MIKTKITEEFSMNKKYKNLMRIATCVLSISNINIQAKEADVHDINLDSICDSIESLSTGYLKEDCEFYINPWHRDQEIYSTQVKKECNLYLNPWLIDLSLGVDKVDEKEFNDIWSVHNLLQKIKIIEFLNTLNLGSRIGEIFQKSGKELPDYNEIECVLNIINNDWINKYAKYIGSSAIKNLENNKKDQDVKKCILNSQILVSKLKINLESNWKNFDWNQIQVSKSDSEPQKCLKINEIMHQAYRPVDQLNSDELRIIFFGRIINTNEEIKYQDPLELKTKQLNILKDDLIKLKNKWSSTETDTETMVNAIIFTLKHCASIKSLIKIADIELNIIKNCINQSDESEIEITEYSDIKDMKRKEMLSKQKTPKKANIIWQ